MEISDIAFPNNIVIALRDDFAEIAPPNPEDSDPGIPVFARPIKVTDPNQCIGVTAGMWMPDEESYELGGGLARTGATINSYIIGVQTFIKHSDETQGLALSATLAGAIRNRITMSVQNRGALSQLSASEFGYRESFSRASLENQRFISNELQGKFLYMSSLELRVETQINPL